jgi:Trk-type K+ transport system membrane component
MMYISIFPVAISIRRTNVYEEKSLGIYAHEDEENASFVGPSRVHPLQKLIFSNAYASPTWLRFMVYFPRTIYHLYR